MSPSVVVLYLLLLHTGVKGFGIFPGTSLNHQEITKRAILNTAVEVCHAMAQNEGTDFTFPVRIHSEIDPVILSCIAVI